MMKFQNILAAAAVLASLSLSSSAAIYPSPAFPAADGTRPAADDPETPAADGTMPAADDPETPAAPSRRDTIKEVLLREETSFNETLDRGLELFDKEVAASGKVSGDFAFKLYDTYGFPIDLTALMARERGLEIDTARFDELMEEQRRRAKAAQKKQVVRALDIKTDCVTEFVGYTEMTCEATVTEVHENDGVLFVITDKTPFYAEMGGQVSDGGTLELNGSQVEVIGVQQIGKARAHLISAADGITPAVGDKVALTLDDYRRHALQAHHSATHLLHKALRELVSADIAQQGSLVEVDRLRFDFNSGAISKADLRRVEERVNQWVEENMPVVCKEYAMAEIKQHKEVCQFFGDKYGDVVRLVQMGGEPGKFDGVSMELCGGTHVTETGKVGVFKIMSEGAIASGVRRIEAACGAAAYHYAANVVAAHKQETADFLAKLSAANEKLAALGQETVAVPADEKQDEAVAKADGYAALTAAVDAYLAYCESVKEAALEADKRMKKAAAAAAASMADAILTEKLTDGNGAFYAEGGNELLTELFNGLRKRHFPAAVFMVVGDGESLMLGSYCGEQAQAAGLKAGDLMRTLAPLAGGKGGGKADMARGSGKPETDVDALLAKAMEALNM